MSHYICKLKCVSGNSHMITKGKKVKWNNMKGKGKK